MSVNCTANGAVPLVGLAVKLAVGAGAGTLTVIVCEAVFDPELLVAVSLAVYVPAVV